MKQFITILLTFLIISFGCKKEKRFFDKNGNEFIEKGNEIFIIPVKYIKTGKAYKLFIFNETSNNIGITEELKIRTNSFKIVNLKDTDTLSLDNGVKFMFGDKYGLEVEDKKTQVAGIGDEFLEDYAVPKDIEWAFVILPIGKGDN